MMPPSFPKSSLSLASLARCRSSTLPRSFSTTSSRPSITGPESPAFINIPQPPQNEPRDRVIIKGKLPPPRTIFKSGPKGYRKISPEYLALTAPLPTKERQASGETHVDERIAWKSRMADSRRENLRAGLVGLYNRKTWAAKSKAQSGVAKAKLRYEALNRPTREDEVFTNPTTTAATRWFQKGPLPDPERENILAASRERTQANEELKSERRKDALQVLYMNARSFIVTDQQLDAEIEHQFRPKAFGDYDNIWEEHGPPPTIMDMLSHSSGATKTAMGAYAGPAVITGKRMKRIAEELTGGKMDSE